MNKYLVDVSIDGLNSEKQEVKKIYMSCHSSIIVETNTILYEIQYEYNLTNEDLKNDKSEDIDNIEYLLNYKGRIMDNKSSLDDKEELNRVNFYCNLIYDVNENIDFNINDYIEESDYTEDEEF